MNIFKDMQNDILTANQLELLPLIREFSRDYYLAGGTAIALYLGHRRSIDFDLFTSEQIKKRTIKKTLDRFAHPVSDILFEDPEQLHIIINAVKVTFFSYPYPVVAKTDFDQIIKMPDLLTLSAMKAFALGGRAKWKDYVDLFFLLRDHFSLQQISEQAKRIFSAFFNEKLFREQLCYFQDIDYSEEVDFVTPAFSGDEIKRFLTDAATTPFR
jgi:hypothetical protein